jgi:hypothetical protein
MAVAQRRTFYDLKNSHLRIGQEKRPEQRPMPQLLHAGSVLNAAFGA